MADHPIVQTMSDRVRVAPNMELYYRAWLPSRPRMTLVLIHGAGQHSGLFAALGGYCVPHAMAVYALDLRGFGQSMGVRGHIRQFEEYLDDLDQFIAWVRTRHPHHPVFVLGHSLGATIAIRYGQERTSCLDGVIVSAPALRMRTPIPRHVHAALGVLSRLTPGIGLDLGRWQPVLSRLGWFSTLMTPDLRLPSDPWATGRFTVRWLTELLRNGQQALDQAPAMRLAILSLCSATDPLIDPAAVHQFFASLTMRDKQHIVLSQAPHDWILQNNAQDPVYAYIVQWLAAHA